MIVSPIPKVYAHCASDVIFLPPKQTRGRQRSFPPFCTRVRNGRCGLEPVLALVLFALERPVVVVFPLAGEDATDRLGRAGGLVGRVGRVQELVAQLGAACRPALFCGSHVVAEVVAHHHKGDLGNGTVNFRERGH